MFTAAVFFLLPLFSLFPQESFSRDHLDRWFDKPEAQSYRRIRSQIYDLFETALEDELPASILFDKLLQGAARNADPEMLLSALQAALQRTRKADNIIGQWTGKTEDPDLLLTARKNLVLYLQAGLDAEGLKKLSDTTLGEGRDLSDLFTAAEIIIQLRDIIGLEAEKSFQFAFLLLQSGLAEESWTVLPSVFLRAATWRIPPGETYAVISEALRSGGGLLQIERELGRRKRD